MINHDTENPYYNLGRDMFFILISVLLAILLVRFGVVRSIISIADEGRIIGSFISGIFFTSIFTIAPASIALVELSKTLPIISVAFFGAAGAVVGDLILFLFIRDRFSDDLSKVLHNFHDKKFTRFFHRKFFKWLTPVVGALIIASPLPDELGVAMMGTSKIKTSSLIAISFVMNFIGVLVVVFMASSL